MFKSILLILLCPFIVLNATTTNGIFVVIDGYPTFELVAKGKARNTNTVVIGRTYEVGKESYYFGTNQAASFYFGNGLLLQIEKNTELSLISYDQEWINLEVEPQPAKSGAHLFNIVITHGEALISYIGNTNEYSSCVVSTPLVDIELKKGKFYLKIEKDGAMIFVLEGGVIGHGERKRKITCDTGKAIIAMPIPIRFQPKGIDDNIEEISLSIKKTKVEEVNRLLGEIDKLENKAKSYTFCVVNGKVIAIKNFH